MQHPHTRTDALACLSGSPAEHILKNPHVILVDPQDQPLGICEKVHAHRIGALHRAVSVYMIRPPRGKQPPLVLLQKRSMKKYHAPGLWSGTACTHPQWNETNAQAAHRALFNELGIQGATLTSIGSLCYQVPVGSDMIESELVHLFLAVAGPDMDMQLHPDEVEDTSWQPASVIAQMIHQSPESFSPWFPLFFRILHGRGNPAPFPIPHNLTLTHAQIPHVASDAWTGDFTQQAVCVPA